MEAVTDFLVFDSKITVDGDCSHGREPMTNLDSILKSRDITANKGPYSQSYVFFQ